MRLFLVCLVALNLTLTALYAQASPLAVVPLTTGPGYAPYTDQQSAQGGLAVEVVRAAFQHSGQQIDLKWLPWKRGYALTLAGAFQATFPYSRSPEREKDFIFSDPIVTIRSYLYTRRGDTTLSFNVPASFRGRVICAPQGYNAPLESTLQTLTARGEVRFERVPDYSSCMRMLAAGRVDAFTAQDELGLTVLHQTEADTFVQRSPQPVVSVDLMLIAPRNDPRSQALIDLFNAGLRRSKLDGTYQKLLNH